MSGTLALLPRRDQEYLISKSVDFEISQAPDGIHLTIARFAFPDGYRPNIAALRIILPPGYDNANPDMFWTRPNVLLSNGQFPRTADVLQQFGDGLWQRWSRHFADGWRPGIDGIRTYLASIRRELARGI
ncbi:MAG: E2/UBC family protein [Gemmatimonadaceae bacterium]